MRRFSLILCLLFGTVVLSCGATGGEKRFAIVIHGGAGKISADPEHRSGRERVLKKALNLGRDMLRDNRSSLDTVEAVVRILEDSPLFNAGKGAVFNAAGSHELDATIMSGVDRSTGAVGGVTTFPTAISRLITEKRGFAAFRSRRNKRKKIAWGQLAASHWTWTATWRPPRQPED
jgi:beta-aspartyl-peptidase (threonine type)